MSSGGEQMVLGPDAFSCGIQKKLIYSGKEPVEFQDGTKVFFHYRTEINGDPNQVIDDSKRMNVNKPMELIIGKKFKLEIWERALKTMWLGETSRFSVAKQLLFDYPVVSKQLRDYYNYDPCCESSCDHKHKGHNHQSSRQHCCGFNLIEHGVGHADLDALLKSPQPLDFILELIRVEQPGDYKKEAWTLSDEEQTKQIPLLKESGNELFKEKKYSEASKKYEEALGYIEQLMLKEKPHDIEWNELNSIKMPILLNYSMCKFNMNEFYECLEHTNTILESQPSNVKALFRRGKAYAATWNFDKARADFQKCAELDPSLAGEVNSQLNHLKITEQKYLKDEKEKLQGKLF